MSVEDFWKNEEEKDKKFKKEFKDGMIVDYSF